MFARRHSFPSAKYLLALCLLTCWTTPARAQQQQATPPPPPPARSQDDVVRVYTELVQTDVMVFDKQGRFVKDLTRENFELRIDGKQRPIEAFELITAGSNEESQLAAARGLTTVNLQRPIPLDRGRIVFFYVDDFHMNVGDFPFARKTIESFIDKEMGQNDQVAISSATGQIGFLQQLTNDRMVLREAVKRLNARTYSIKDAERPTMSEFHALLIDRQDRDVLKFFITETMRANPGISRDMASHIVRSQASVALSQAAQFNSHTLVGLELLDRTSKHLTGHSVVFFLAGGLLTVNL